MVVCVVTDSFPPDFGGIATFYHHLAKLLIQKNNSIIILMVDHLACAGEEDVIINGGLLTKVVLKQSYLEKFNFYNKYFCPGGMNAPHWIAMGLSIQEWLFQNYLQFQIDVIEVIDTGGLGVFLVNSELPPVIITGHGTITQYYSINHTKKNDHYKLLVELEKSSFKCADYIVACSPLNQKALEKTFKRSVSFSNPPWNVEEFSNSSNTGTPLIVSSVQKIKGAELFCNALVMVTREIHDITCEWVGPDFYTAPNAKSMVSFLREKFGSVWARNFLWTGELERTATISKIANAEFLIIPSIFETFNYVSLEAATLGKAILMTEGTGASYLFTHNENALVVPNDAKKLAEEIIRLKNQKDLCERLGANARKMVNEAFDPKLIYTGWMNNYSRAIESRKKNGIVSNPDLSSLGKYITPLRKKYYQARTLIKKMVKPV